MTPKPQPIIASHTPDVVCKILEGGGAHFAGTRLLQSGDTEKLHLLRTRP
jgi:hypothetical protein